MSTSRHRNLEGAFALPPTTRASGLAGLLPPKTTTAQRTEQATPSDEPHAEALAPRPATTVRPKTPPKTSGGVVEAPGSQPRPGRQTSQILNVGIYLPPETLEAARVATRTRAITYADLLVEAFDHVDEGRLRAAFAPPAAQAVSTGMPKRAARPTGDPGIQRQFRLSPEQRDWIDTQVEAFGAPSRSALGATVLALHLNTTDVTTTRR